MSDLYSARLFAGRDRDHFRRVAVLRLKAIAGERAANVELERAITAGALTAEAELRRFEGGAN